MIYAHAGGQYNAASGVIGEAMRQGEQLTGAPVAKRPLEVSLGELDRITTGLESVVAGLYDQLRPLMIEVPQSVEKNSVAAPSSCDVVNAINGVTHRIRMLESLIISIRERLAV